MSVVRPDAGISRGTVPRRPPARDRLVLSQTEDRPSNQRLLPLFIRRSLAGPCVFQDAHGHIVFPGFRVGCRSEIIGEVCNELFHGAVLLRGAFKGPGKWITSLLHSMPLE
jgi:hypothetical protein